MKNIRACKANQKVMLLEEAMFSLGLIVFPLNLDLVFSMFVFFCIFSLETFSVCPFSLDLFFRPVLVFFSSCNRFFVY